jgi:hypothetical protein
VSHVDFILSPFLALCSTEWIEGAASQGAGSARLTRKLNLSTLSPEDCLAASLFPATQAASINPIEALRTE